METSSQAAGSAELSADCIIVGAGFSGCYALHMLREQGYSAKMIDAGSDFGGVWHFNKYPGALVDSESPLYQLSLRKAWQGFSFGQRFPGYQEMQAYFRHVGDVLDLRRDAVFQHYITKTTYDRDAGVWHLESDKGLRATARFVIFATGTTNKAYAPPFPGMDRFMGRVVHSRSWPDDVCLGEQKRIALIGQGSTGTQIAQEIAKLDADVTVFVRTPSVAYPLQQRDISIAESERFKANYDAVFSDAKRGVRDPLDMIIMDKSYHQETPEQHRALWEQLWEAGSLRIPAGNYPDIMTDKEANAAFYQFWREKTLRRIKDPAKREVLAPREQPLWFMAKRPVMETDYFEMMDRDNVKIVDLKHSRIKEFVETGIVTVTEEQQGGGGGGGGGGEETLHEFDLVILATGYDSVTGSLHDMNISDKDGVPLRDKWRDGVSTHLGMMIPGMPSAFLLYGPQTPGPLTTAPSFVEVQVELVCRLLARAGAEGRRAVEATEDAAAAWREKLHAAFGAVLASEGDSWWVGANIPGKRREPLIWFGGVPSWLEASEATMRSWDDFVPDKMGARL